MAYNVAANMQFAKPVSAFIDARDNVTRNALAERQVANQEGAQAFQQQRLTATDQIAAEQRAKASEQEDSVKLHTAMQYLANVSNDPVRFQSTAQSMLQHPEIGRILQGNGVTLEDITPQSVQELLAASGASVGQGPQKPYEISTQQGPNGASIVTDGSRFQVVEPAQAPASEKPVLTDVRLPDGRVQKQWLRPGQSNGTPVGEPTSPDTGPSMRDVTSLRKEFESTPSATQYRAVLPLYNRAKTAPNTRAGDISMIYALGKMFDPTSVVREGELVLAQNAAPWLQKMASQANSQLSAKGALSPETRTTILEALQGQVDSFRLPYEQERQRYSQYASEYGIDPFKVVGNDASAAFSDAKAPDPKTMNPPAAPGAARVPDGVAIYNKSKSGRDIVSVDGGKNWTYK